MPRLPLGQVPLASRVLVGIVVALSVLVHLQAGARSQAADKTTAAELFARALGNDDVCYTATRTSIFWADNGQTRALLARVYKEGDQVRYEYPARGNRAASVVIETPDALYFVRQGADRTRVTTAHRSHDRELDAVRVKLALANYQWRYEPTNTPRRRIVSAWRAGAEHPSHRFWIATTPMVVVRSERYGPHGELRSSWALDSMHTTSDLPDSLFTPPHGPDLEVREASLPEQVKLEDVNTRAGFQAVRLPDDKIPEGYRLVDIAIEQTAGGAQRNAVRFVYSDGLDSFSLLETPRVKGATEKIRAQHAQDVNILDTTAQIFTSAEANLVHWQDQKRLYTLMGALPTSALLELSRGVITANTSPRMRPITSVPVSAIQAPRHRGINELITRGWTRFLKMFGW